MVECVNQLATGRVRVATRSSRKGNAGYVTYVVVIDITFSSY